MKERVYRPDIDGLRAIAVIAVMVFHLDESWLPGGYLGVDVFFVISGYVVTGALTGTTLTEFYAKRLRRLYPALMLCILLTAITTVILLPASIAGGILKSGIFASVGASNLYFFWTSENYFALLGSLNPYAQTWSLGVEEQFYLIYPVLLLFLPRTWKAFALVLGVAIIVAAIANYWSEKLWFYTLVGRFWELFLGAFLYQIRGTARGQGLGRIGICLILASFFFPSTIVAALGSALVIHGRLSALTIGPLVKVGLLSYSLYLFHWPVFTFFRLLSDLPGNAMEALAITLLFAIASYTYVERPIRRSNVSVLQMSNLLAMSVGTLYILAVPMRGALYAGEHEPPEQWLAKVKCHSPQVSDPIAHCLERTTEEPTIFLIGDSHAGSLRRPLRAVANEYGLGFQQLTGRALALSLTGRPGCGGMTCQADETAARAAFITRLQPGDTVVFSMFSRRLNNAQRFDLDRLVKSVPEHAQILLVNDTPVLNVDFIQCVTGLTLNCATSLKDAKAVRRPLTEALMAAGGIYFDPIDVFCPDKKCSLFDESGRLMYTDARFHLTAAAADRLTPAFIELFSSLTPDHLDAPKSEDNHSWQIN